MKALTHDCKTGKFEEIEVAEIGETLFRKGECWHRWNGETVYKYEQVTHRVVPPDLMQIKPDGTYENLSHSNRVAELEKENADLKAKVTENYDLWCDACAKSRDNYIRAEKLEKENASLRQALDGAGIRQFELSKEIAHLKKRQVVWIDDESDGHYNRVEQQGQGIYVHWHQFNCLLPLPPAEKDEALEAWGDHYEGGSSLSKKEAFIAGYRAREAKEKSK